MPRVVGGSEALAWQYAALLSSRFEVDLLTSTALRLHDLEKRPAGGPERMRDGIPVQRFPVEFTRGEYLFTLTRD